MQHSLDPIQVLSNVQVSAGIIFILIALGLHIVRTRLPTKSVSANIGLCLAGAVYSSSLGAAQFDLSIAGARTVQHLAWTSGSFVLCFYVAAIERFVQSKSKIIRGVIRTFFAIGVASSIATAYYLLTGQMVLYSTGQVVTDSLFVPDVVKNNIAFNPLTMALGGTTFLLQLSAMAIFIRRMLAKKMDSTLTAMTVFGGAVVLYEISLAVFPQRYGFSLLFLSVLLESSRLAFLNIREAATQQESLKQTAIETHFLVRALGLGVWRLELPNGDTEWDDGMFPLFGVERTPNFSANATWLDAIHPDDQERSGKDFSDAVEGIRPYDTVFRIILPNGELRSIGTRATIERDDAGRPRRAIGVSWDCTELTTERLKNADLTHNLEAVAKNFPGIIGQFELRPDGSMTMPYVVHEGLKILDLTAADYERDHTVVINLVHPVDLPGLIAATRESAIDMSRFYWTGRIRTKNGAVKWVQIASLPQPLAHGGVLWHGVIMDVTREKELEDALNHERAKAIQTARLASLGEVSAGLAHEINNPLGIIAGTVDNLPLFFGNQEKIDARIKTIKRSIERIAKIVNGLKKFSRRTDADTFQNKNFADLISESLILTQSRAVADGVQISFEHDGPGPINCHEIEIEQVIVNLLNNAIDAVKDLPDRWVKLVMREEKDTVLLRVTDAGGGIKPFVRERLFQPFFTTKPVGEGTGLGLSISRGIVAAHGGRIEVPTEAPHTCFEVLLPRATGAHHAD